MATTTPAQQLPGSGHQRNSSQSRSRPPSRPQTPLRPPSRTSLRASQSTPSGGASISSIDFPLASLEPAFAEFSDGMADLEANFMHLQLLNESLGRFNENFGAFLYGLNMSAFCVDFPEAPIAQSFARHKDFPSQLHDSPFRDRGPADQDATFLTTDTSFIDNPPTSSKAASKYATTPSAKPQSTRQTIGGGRGGSSRGIPAPGVARNTSTRGGAAGTGRGGGGGIARGAGRGRGSTRS